MPVGVIPVTNGNIIKSRRKRIWDRADSIIDFRSLIKCQGNQLEPSIMILPQSLAAPDSFPHATRKQGVYFMGTAIVVSFIFTVSSAVLLVVYSALLLGARCEKVIRERPADSDGGVTGESDMGGEAGFLMF
jgi:hypothetical protein